MLSSIGEAVVGVSDQGLVQFFNPMAETLAGWSAKDILGKPFMHALRIVDQTTRQPLLDIEAMVREPHALLPFSDSGVLVGRHGAELPIDLSATCIQSPAGDFFGIALVFRDVSERRKTEEALKQSVCNLRRTLEETVKALAVTAEKRDPYTAGHQQRVAKLASAIAEKLGLDPDRIDGLRVASLLHDIGKIYVPAEILAKPARLTRVEMELMKTHSEVGYDILKSVSFPWPVAEMVLQHHERMDGRGYPAGFSGDEIIYEARIIMVADVIEAMSSHRPYRAALGVDIALEEITKNCGQRYDAATVDACLELFASADFSFES
jgi:putative nucleotidyltransferase with HDIG domain/PAS domain S-box-containing protein